MISQLLFVLILVSECSHYSRIVVQASNFSHNRMFSLTQSPNTDSSCRSCLVDAGIVVVGQDLQREFKACQWEKFVFVTQSGVNKNVVEYIRQTFTSGPLSVTLSCEVAMKTMEMSVFADVIWNAYNKQRIFNFIWITRQPKYVIEAAHSLFRQKFCGSGALMTSRINFIFVTFTTDISKIALDLKSSLFDNLAIFAINEDQPTLEKVFTHMWRINRSREFQEIADFGDGSSDGNTAVCKIFPNIKNGFNGRHFYGLAKEWLPEFFKARNEVTGEIVYSGFYIDVFDTLATTLNFTYTLVPPPDTKDNLTWTAYTQMVSNCQVDFGINLFTSNAIFHYNISTSFPVLYSNFIGAYINRSKPDPYKIFLVFKLETYMVIIGLLFVTVLLYLLLNHALVPPGEGLLKPESRTDEQKSPQKQIGSGRIQRSSVFEADWQAKYKCLETAESSIYKEMGTRRKRQTCYQNTLHYKIKPFHRRIRRLKKINFSTKHYFAKFYSSKIKKNNRNKNNISNWKINNLRAKESMTYNRRRNDIYNNSSHYVTEFVSKHCFVLFEYQTFPQQHAKTEHMSQRREKHSLRTTGTELLNMISIKQQYLFDVSFGFLGTIANQGTLPDAVHWAPRVLLAAWSFMMVILVATYNGNLTATFVDTTEEVPIKSFDDLLSKSEYRWGTWNETLMYSLLKASEPGTTLRKLYEGINRFSKADPSVLGGLNDIIAHIKSGKFVALISSFTFEYLEEYTDLPGLTVIPDTLLTGNGAFVFPNNSELNTAISRQLVAMRDSGVTNHIFQRLRIGINTTTKVIEDHSNEYLNMDNVAGVFFISCYGVVISLVALVIEILISKFQSKM